MAAKLPEILAQQLLPLLPEPLPFIAVRDSLEDEESWQPAVPLSSDTFSSILWFTAKRRGSQRFMMIGFVARKLSMAERQALMAREEVLALLWELELHEKHNEQLLWNLFHEIRNPICGILNTTHLMLSVGMTKEPEMQRKVQLIADCTSTLLQLSGDLLELHKLKERKLSLQPKSVAVRPFLQACCNLFHDPVHFQVTCAVHTGIPDLLYFDDVRLRQVIFNLLINARKYGSRVATLRAVWDKEKLYCEVEDQGQGIPKSQFRSLFRVQIAHEASGLGIGLITCHYLLRLMKGDIFVKRSEVNEGTTFAFHLWAPAAAGSANAAAPSALASAPAPANAAPRSPRQSPQRSPLIVDDNAFVSQSLQYMIEHVTGQKPDIASNGVEAVLKFEHGNYDLLFIDLRMPQLRGFETVHEILKFCQQQQQRAPPLIYLISAFVLTPEEEKLCRDWKLAGFLRKPFQMQDIYRIFGQQPRSSSLA